MAEATRAGTVGDRGTASWAPLSDVRVLEVGDYEAVQYCGRLLASLGATVVKVEPAEGDPLRRRPPFVTAPGGRMTSVPFEYLNAGKQIASVDLDTQAGCEDLDALVRASDVVLVVPEYLGHLDVTSLNVQPPQLLVRVGPCGGDDVDGPTTAFTRFHTAINGYLIPADKDRTARPAWPGPYAFEAVHGTAVAAAVLAEMRRGTGGEIDYSYQGYGLWLEKMFVPRVTTRQVPDLHRWNAAQAFGGVMTCRDGFVSLFVIEEHQWQALCHMIGRDDWLGDERFADGSKRVQNQDAIQAVLVEWFAERTADEAMAAGSGTDIPLGRVRPLDQLTDWDLLREREFFQENPHGFGPPSLPSLPYGPFRRGRRLRPATSWTAQGDQAGRRGDLPDPDGPSGAADRSTMVGRSGPATGRPPLAGVRVLDLTWAAAGPGITSLMAFLGADVVKVEVRSRPDLMRIAGRQYGYGETDLDSSPSFEEIGAGKRSIELDLRRSEDLQTIRELLGAADVFVENMRPGKVEQLGLSYQATSAINPRVVMCSQSGTGRTSARGVPGYAPVFWAEGGGASVTGHPTGLPGIVRGPIDFHAATTALLGVLCILRDRDRTGRGGYIDCSAIECVVSLFGVELMQLPWVQGRCGNAFSGMLLNDVFPASGADEWVAVSIPDSAAWEAFMKVLQLDLPAPPHGQGPELEAVHGELSQATGQQPASGLARELRKAGVPAAASVSIGAALEDERLARRGSWQKVDYDSGERMVVGLPWRYGAEPYPLARKAPRLGEHTQEVLHEWLHGER